MSIELAEKKIADVVRDNLGTLKKIEDVKIKEVVVALEGALKKYDDAIIEVVKNDKKEPEKKDESITESEKVEKKPVKEEKDADKPVVVKEPDKPVSEIEKPAPAEKNEKVIAGEVQLSMEVADKLKEAALELDNKDSTIKNLTLELSAKNEIISGYKNKITGLQKSIELFKEELNVYKKKQELELKNQKVNLIKDLIELYSNLNIAKTSEELQIFGLSQLVELRKALEVTLDKKNTPVRRTTNSQSMVVKQQQKESVDTTKETFEGLFGKNPDLI